VGEPARRGTLRGTVAEPPGGWAAEDATMRRIALSDPALRFIEARGKVLSVSEQLYLVG
jgi:hypothetical protein